MYSRFNSAMATAASAVNRGGRRRGDRGLGRCNLRLGAFHVRLRLEQLRLLQIELVLRDGAARNETFVPCQPTARVFVAGFGPTDLRFSLLKLGIGLRETGLGLFKLCLGAVQFGNERTWVDDAKEIALIDDLTFRQSESTADNR